MKQWYICDTYDIVHPNVSKLLSKMHENTQTSDINVNLVLCHILRGGVHLTKMSL